MPAFRAAAVLFDLDGTLADTAHELHQSAVAALTDAGLPPIEFTRARDFIGDGTPRFIKRLITRQWWGEPPAEVYQQVYENFSTHYQTACVESRLYDCVPSVLAQFAAGAVKMACVTNKPERYTLPLLQAHGLCRYFSAVVCGDTLPVKKPDPAPLYSALKVLAVPADAAVMVGDSITDSRAAAAAGCKFIFMRYGYYRQPPPADAAADRFDAIPQLLQQLSA